jgi:hypothetical protein
MAFAELSGPGFALMRLNGREDRSDLRCYSARKTLTVQMAVDKLDR